MTTARAGGSVDSGFDDLTENVPRAKRDLVLRFVKDQEALQTSQVDLKIVDDETIDLMDSVLVVKGEDTKLTTSDNSAKRDQNILRPLSREIASLSLETEIATNFSEAIIVPRPPSGRPRTRSVGGRNRSVSKNIQRKYSANDIPDSGEQCRFEQGKVEFCHYNSRDLIAQESTERTDSNSSPNTEGSGSGMNLNASWPQECLSRKLLIPPWKRSIYATKETPYYYNTPVENFSGIDNHSEALRPRSSQSFQRVRPAEIISARISSASECDRITCDASSLTKPPSYTKKLHKGSRRRTYINFNRLDAQIALEGPLELQQVHPSDIPLYRSSSAASSSVPYALVHVPPIGREGPAPSSS